MEGHEGEVIRGALEFLKNFSNFNVIIEFGSLSSINGVQLLAQHFTFSMKLYRWMQPSIEVDMKFVNDEKKRITTEDLVLINLRKK